MLGGVKVDLSADGERYLYNLAVNRRVLTVNFRGLAGTVLVYKIAGALARRGASLDEVYNTAQLVASRIGTIGVGLEHCHVR